MEKTSFQTLINMVEVQNFVRTKKIVNINKYIDTCENFVEYLIFIALLETECIHLIQVLETLAKHYIECKKTGIKTNSTVVHIVFELLCKSEKNHNLWKLLVKYYFEDQKYISGDFTKIKAKSRNLKDIIVINVIKKMSEYFSYNKYLVTALLGYLQIYLESKNDCLINNNPALYISARTLITVEPETYNNTDESLLAEMCVFWMNLSNTNIKNKMIKEYKSLIQRLYISDIIQ
jgi:hypothetical protein